MSVTILQTARWNPTEAVLALAAFTVVAGCAGGTWIQSPSDAELSIDEPVHSYPTAVGTVASAPVARITLQSDNSPPARAVPQPASTASPAALQPASSPSASASPVAAAPAQPKSLPPPVAPLAVLPPQLRPDLARQTSSTPQPASVPDQAASEPAPAASSVPAAPSPAGAAIVAASEPVKPSELSQLPAAASPAHSLAASEEISPAEQAAPPAGSSRGERAWTELIASLESDIRERRQANPKDIELPRLEQKLRLVYLAASRLDDAATAVESLDESQREAFKQVMFGLGVWLSPDESRRAPLRTAKVLQALREATSDLVPSSKLELRKLAFCERVDYFGWYTEFPRNEFQPKQQVILYVEVDNFAADQKSPAAYETELHGSYQILDGSGQIVAEKQLPPDKEVCRNYRRDYFLAYRIYMPDAIAAGRYRLELTIEDLKARTKYPGRKLGEGMIEFTIRQ